MRQPAHSGPARAAREQDAGGDDACRGGAQDAGAEAVRPRTGRAVSREAGAPYADKLLRLPPFMLGAQAGLSEGDVRSGLDLTGHFLEQFVFHPQNKPIPPARVWLMDKLGEAGRL